MAFLGKVNDLGKTVPVRQIGMQAHEAGAAFAKPFHTPSIDKVAKPKAAPIAKSPMYHGLMMKGGW